MKQFYFIQNKTLKQPWNVLAVLANPILYPLFVLQAINRLLLPVLGFYFGWIKCFISAALFQFHFNRADCFRYGVKKTKWTDRECGYANVNLLNCANVIDPHLFKLANKFLLQLKTRRHLTITLSDISGCQCSILRILRFFSDFREAWRFTFL